MSPVTLLTYINRNEPTLRRQKSQAIELALEKALETMENEANTQAAES